MRRVVDARDRIGGRVWLQRAALRGLDLHMGGAWIADTQPRLGGGRPLVHFAGAYTVLHWPSPMDGAIESGLRVAAEVRRAM